VFFSFSRSKIGIFCLRISLIKADRYGNLFTLIRRLNIEESGRTGRKSARIDRESQVFFVWVNYQLF